MEARKARMIAHFMVTVKVASRKRRKSTRRREEVEGKIAVDLDGTQRVGFDTLPVDTSRKLWGSQKIDLAIDNLEVE